MDSKIADLKERTPVVSIMGHVNHGKTTLLDAFRNSHKYEEEFGHITQSLEAFTINLFKHVTFIDTPGHEAFGSMRLRGA